MVVTRNLITDITLMVEYGAGTDLGLAERGAKPSSKSLKQAGLGLSCVP